MHLKRKNAVFFVLPVFMLVFFVAESRLLSRQIAATGTGGQRPGVPQGYTIIDGDIQMPITRVSPRATIEISRFWPNVVIPFQFETEFAPTSSCLDAPNSGHVSADTQALMINAMAV